MTVCSSSFLPLSLTLSLSFSPLSRSLSLSVSLCLSLSLSASICLSLSLSVSLCISLSLCPFCVTSIVVTAKGEGLRPHSNGAALEVCRVHLSRATQFV